MNRVPGILGGIAATLAAGALWHGPLGAGDRLAARLESEARISLVSYEMESVTAKMERGPLSRTVRLSGTADEFQRGQLVKIMNVIPGVAAARWSDAGKSAPLPLAIEAELLALLGFSFGLLLAYLAELRRRGRQWDRF